MERQGQRIGLTKDQILGLGISNQRETVVCWDHEGNPLYNALVWCDTRTEQICRKFEERYGTFSHRTGLPISTYFSMFKILWMLQHVEGLLEKVKAGEARFGTIDSWVAYKLTGNYVTDASNASRTHLCDIKTGDWDTQLLELAQLTRKNLPKIVDSFSKIGKVREGRLTGVEVSCLLGDQQASAFAHSLKANQMKITYGTGCFLLSNIGTQPVFDESFVTTILNRDKDGVTNYGFEVAVECGGGTLNWAHRLGLFQEYSELNHLPATHPGLYFFPSFGAIFSPFWKSNVPGGLVGLGFNTTRQHILRSVLDSITFRLYDNIRNPSFVKVQKIIVDGGMTRNNLFMQMQANLFEKEIEVRSLDTCWGVAKGVLASLSMPVEEGNFETKNYRPGDAAEIQQKYEEWCRERKKLYGWGA